MWLNWIIWTRASNHHVSELLVYLHSKFILQPAATRLPPPPILCYLKACFRSHSLLGYPSHIYQEASEVGIQSGPCAELHGSWMLGAWTKKRQLASDDQGWPRYQHRTQVKSPEQKIIMVQQWIRWAGEYSIAQKGLKLMGGFFLSGWKVPLKSKKSSGKDICTGRYIWTAVAELFASRWSDRVPL